MFLNICNKIKKLAILLGCGLALAACGGGGSGDGTAGGGVGTLSTSLTDASTEDYQAVYVTIARVDVHHDSDGTWQTVAEPNRTYNLLDLVNGVRETLGIATLDAGHYTQMRLIIGQEADDGLNILSLPHQFANYVIDTADDEIHELKVPSGTNTGLKIVNGFDINEDQTTELILDFDASRSVVKAGQSGQYLLKPTVKVLNGDNYAIVTGTVKDDPFTAVQAGALVTAQMIDGEPPGLVIEGGTIAGEDGGYSLFLAPGIYNLVATKAGFLPACASVDLAPNSLVTQDLTMETDPLDLGSITVAVTIVGAPADQHATVEFRQDVLCMDEVTSKMIIVKSVNIANGDTATINLPQGTYQVVASTYDRPAQTEEFVVVPPDTPAEPDLSFDFLQ